MTDRDWMDRAATVLQMQQTLIDELQCEITMLRMERDHARKVGVDLAWIRLQLDVLMKAMVLS